MCGIVGILDPRGQRDLEGQVRVLCEAMVHRGPDGDGFFSQPGLAMGMRRLSVIDLEGGWQPMYAAGDRAVAFQNGEIYNFRPLRNLLKKEGFQFKTDSDTEVLAHGYSHWGMPGLLQRLDGMFAIAILDRESGRLFLARDRFGEKPLFFAATEGRFAYSSHMTGLAALDWVDDSLDPCALDHYLAAHYVSGPATVLKGIRRVLPGEFLEMQINDPSPVHHRYYLPPIDSRQVSDRDLAKVIENAVCSRLVADVPVGVFLSGGLDSAIVAAIAAREQPQIDTFSMGFANAEYDESAHAAAVAKTVGSRHHHFLFDDQSFMTLLPEVAECLDEPVGDQAMLPVYWLAREARKHVTVVLAGEGADEVFAGYGYYREFAPALTRRERIFAMLGRTARLARGVAAHGLHQRFIHNPVPQTPSGFPLLADPADRERLTGKAWPQASLWEQAFVGALNQTEEPLQRATLADIYTWLADDLLVKFDRMAMAHSLEGRAPFLAPAVVAAGLNLPPSERMTRAQGTSKIALRRVAGRWLPRKLLTKRKQGFCLPMNAWLAQWFREYGGPEAYFAKHQPPGMLTDQVCDLVAADLSAGVKRERIQFAILLLTEWHHRFRTRQKAVQQQLTAGTLAN